MKMVIKVKKLSYHKMNLTGGGAPFKNPVPVLCRTLLQLYLENYKFIFMHWKCQTAEWICMHFSIHCIITLRYAIGIWYECVPYVRHIWHLPSRNTKPGTKIKLNFSPVLQNLLIKEISRESFKYSGTQIQVILTIFPIRRLGRFLV